MRWLCKLVGHAPLTTAGWQSGVGYASVAYTAIDGLGTRHYYLEAKCPRCGKLYRICNIHEKKETK